MADNAGARARVIQIAELRWQTPDWPAPARVGALVTTRYGGDSVPPYDSFNLGTHVGDDLASVRRNRRLLRGVLPELRRLQWLNQVHGNRVVTVAPGLAPLPRRQADAGCIEQPGDGVAVLTADCLPVLLCARDGHVAAAAHAGWRGLLNGVLENTVRVMGVRGSNLMAWLGPAIGPCCFEVGDEVKAAFMAATRPAAESQTAIASAFESVTSKPGKSLMDIYAVARQRLLAAGVSDIHGGAHCTVCENEQFYSYRRDGKTGRMASLIYLKDC